MSFVQGIDAIQVWVKKGTPDVPDDGRFHVVHGNSVVGSFRRQAQAIAEYRKLVRESGYVPEATAQVADTDSLLREDIERDLDRTAAYWSSSGGFRGPGRFRNR